MHARLLLPFHPRLIMAALLAAALESGAQATDATVSIGDLNQVYNGQPRPVTVTTDPAGLSVLVTYNGSNTVPSQPGTYSVVASVTATNYRGSATATETISSASGTTTTTTSATTSATATSTATATASSTTGSSDTSSGSSSPCGFGAGAGGALGLMLMLLARRTHKR